MNPLVAKSILNAQVRRIAPGDSNYFVLLFDPAGDDVEPTCVVEIFEVGGRTPPNTHRHAQEFFFVLSGEGLASCGELVQPLRKGLALLIRPGAEHVIENTGTTKLYTLTFMVPNEGLAELVRAGAPVALDDEDRSVLAGVRHA
jgi:mannose-6-phosphate isomerase-like protein (cupin superfamily)